MKYIYLFVFLFCCGLLPAQTQQGIVKTRGRMSTDGVLIPGTRLSDATITLNIGNPLISDKQGFFSFNVPPQKKYSLLSVKKQGYTLSDPDYTQRYFSYSSTTPFFIVLEDENQRQADINAATRKVRNTLFVQLAKREEEIEALKQQNQITEKEYQTRLQKLYDDQSKSEKLVKEMAERYATTDYDLLDEFNRKVQLYIEEGELQKADSMIRSKGDMEQRVTEYHNIVAANREEREKLEQSEAGAARNYEELSQDLLHQSEIYLQRFLQDSALYCLKMRADLDTTNAEAIVDYAMLCSRQKKYVEGLNYWQLCLRSEKCQIDVLFQLKVLTFISLVYRGMYDYDNSKKYLTVALNNVSNLSWEESESYRSCVARIHDAMGVLCRILHDYQESEKYQKMAIEDYQILVEMDPNRFQADLAKAHGEMGMLLFYLRRYEDCESYYNLALDAFNQLYEINPDRYRPDLATIQSNIASYYYHIKNYEESEKYFKLSLKNEEQLFVQNPDAYRVKISSSQNNIGAFYASIGNLTESEKYQKLALENRSYLFEQNPNTYRAVYVSTLSNLGSLYLDKGDYSESTKYYEMALINYEILFKQHPQVYQVDLARIQHNLGNLYTEQKNYTVGEKYYLLALDLFNDLMIQNPQTFRSSIESTQNKLGILYYDCADFVNSEKYYKMALANRLLLYESNPRVYRNGLINIYYCLTQVYLQMRRYDEAIVMIDHAISFEPFEPLFHNLRGEVLLAQGKHMDALSSWSKILEIDPDYLQKNPNRTELSAGLKKLGLIE